MKTTVIKDNHIILIPHIISVSLVNVKAVIGGEYE